MKLTTFIMLIALTQVSAATFAQKLTFSKQGASLREVFMQIKTQTGYNVLYSPDHLDARKKVNVNFEQAELDEVLKKLINAETQEYSIVDNNILIKKREISVFDKMKEKFTSTIDLFVQQDSILYRGKILDERGQPLIGANIYLKGGTKGSVSTSTGYFQRYGTLKGTLVIRYVGYITKEISLAGLDSKQEIIIRLVPGENNLDEVTVLNTGYYQLPKERATGSFEVISAKDLQHSNDPNLIKRLEGITTSTIFNNQGLNTPTNSASGNSLTTIRGQFLSSPLTNLTIRGKNSLTNPGASDAGNANSPFSKINSSGVPLVVIDGIANPYDISLLNPEDVENVVILKDAAAASIWGSRAANGVIVVTTKKGRFNAPLRVSFKADVNISDKLDLFYKKTMSTSDYINSQVYGYNQQFPGTNTIAPPALPFSGTYRSPVVEIVNAWKRSNGAITLEQRDAQLDALRANDIRNDYDKYLSRNAVNQNYSLNLSGGMEKMSYNLSGGYTKTLGNTINNVQDGIRLKYDISIKPVKNLELYGSISYSQQDLNGQATQNRIKLEYDSFFTPYTKLADEQGNALEIPWVYRPLFINMLESAYGNNILSMRYKPLENINEGYQNSKNQNLSFNLDSKYNLLPWLTFDLIYNYTKGSNEESTYYSQNSFYMRDLINRFTSVSGTTYTRKIPLGGQYMLNTINTDQQALQGKLLVNKTWNDKHEISALLGMDAGQFIGLTKTDGYYGYDPKTRSINPKIDYVSGASATQLFGTTFIDGLIVPLPGGSFAFSDYKTRSLSFLSNVAYTYDRKYTVSASVRKDGRSDFGIGTNKTGSPFYSVGALWTINNERFYQVNWLPSLSLRGSFGYNGNVNPATYASQLINNFPIESLTRLVAANLTTASVTNRELRPEKTGILNLGLDFAFKGRRVSGSLEYYTKHTTDLLAINKVDPTLGYIDTKYNTANTNAYGIDLKINSLNVEAGKFSWNSSFLFSYNRVKVTKLYIPKPKTAETLVIGTNNPYDVGYDLSRLFAFKWGGLDPVTGDPRGVLNGQPVTVLNDNSYLPIALAPASTAVYIGSAVPVYVGAFNNSFNYGAFSLSAIIMYKLGYYLRRPISDIVNYGALFTSSNIQQGIDYANRWQKPGDELHTDVPSLVYSTNAQDGRNTFYQFSEINVLKGDHIRLKEVNLSYTIRSKANWFIKNPRIYINVPVNVILWRANRMGIDPEIYDYPVPRQYGFGISASF